MEYFCLGELSIEELVKESFVECMEVNGFLI